MNLTDAQKQLVATWINEGLKLSEIQKRLEKDFDLRPTYMDVKLLVSDLKLTPKDPEPPKEPVVVPGAKPAGPPGGAAKPTVPAATPGRVTVTADQLARPGSLVSGSVTFSDGKSANWHLDQTGRLGFAPNEKGYRPSPTDMQEFQVALEQEIARLGY